MNMDSERMEDTLISVWRQVMIEDAKVVHLPGQSCAVRRTNRSKLREIDFDFQGRKLRGLEQNPSTRSRWAELARSGKKVMQFLENGRYVGVVVDGKAQLYNHS